MQMSLNSSSCGYFTDITFGLNPKLSIYIVLEM